MSAVVVLVAMAEEAEPFLAAADEVSEPVTIGRAEHRGVQVGGHTIVLVRTGIGMVNAADAAHGAIARYGAEALLVSAGTAGGLGADIAVGEVVAGDAYINVAADATTFGYVKGQVPKMPAVYTPPHDVANAFVPSAPDGIIVRLGAIGSGEKFATTPVALELRHDFPSLLAVDMESAAIAQVAFNHGAPFVSVRAISDIAAPDGTEFLTHVDDAASRSAHVVLAALPALASLHTAM
ncbi:MAG: 5'-methylthioadenosine/S-adenosylhomocysteine nucleosidase [Microbacterium sp.]